MKVKKRYPKPMNLCECGVNTKHVTSKRCGPCARQYVGSLLRGGNYVVQESRSDKEKKIVSPWDVEKSREYLSKSIRANI